MTERELREIKRRFRPDKSNIARIVGCFVNSNKEIVARISQSIDLAETAVSEKLLAVMKKTLSGSLGTNLTEVSYSTKQVTESEEHKLLMELRKSSLRDTDLLERFYRKAIDSLDFEGNYVILLANDIYDVFKGSSDGLSADSTESFSYLICAVCPLKNAPEAISFKESDNLFHTVSNSCLLSAPELGFMFPAFDDRRTNIYGALYYVRSIAESYDAFAENMLAAEPKMPPKMQKATFNGCLADSLGEECSLEVVKSVHAQISEMIEVHKESKEPAPLAITKSTVKEILSGCGIAEEKIEKLGDSIDESFGKNAELAPKNLFSVNKFNLTLPEVSIKVDPEHKDLVTTQVINGEKYLMIRVTGGVEVNGINVEIE